MCLLPQPVTWAGSLHLSTSASWVLLAHGPPGGLTGCSPQHSQEIQLVGAGSARVTRKGGVSLQATSSQPGKAAASQLAGHAGA